jgi:hypothetical protein
MAATLDSSDLGVWFESVTPNAAVISMLWERSHRGE